MFDTFGINNRVLFSHIYTLAFPDEPTAKLGVILPDVSATLNLSNIDHDYQDFDNHAKGLGFKYGDDAEADIECMGRVYCVQIEEYINHYNSKPAIAFTNSKLYMEDKVSRSPSISSDTAREFPSENITHVNEEETQRPSKALRDDLLQPRRISGLAIEFRNGSAARDVIGDRLVPGVRSTSPSILFQIDG
ncbi:unnamed protein product [Penicillium glandicola]